MNVNTDQMKHLEKGFFLVKIQASTKRGWTITITQLELTMFTCESEKLMLIKVASHENGTCLLIRIGCRVSLSCLMPVMSPSETGGFGLCKRMCHQSFRPGPTQTGMSKLL